MSTFTVEDLRRNLVISAGAPEVEVPDAEFAETTFEDMGYESLALMEVAAVIEREYGVSIPDEQLIEAKTPRQLTATINAAMTGVVA